MYISQADIEDLEDILELQKSAFAFQAEIYDDYDIPPLKQTLEEIEQEYAYKEFYKLVDGDTIVGSFHLTISDEGCCIERVVVEPAYQDNGLGTFMMDFIEENYRHIKRHWLFTGHKSERNLYLYKKLGFSVFKEVDMGEYRFVYLEKLLS